MRFLPFYLNFSRVRFMVSPFSLMLLALAFLVSSCTPSSSLSLQMGGSTTLEPLVSSLLEHVENTPEISEIYFPQTLSSLKNPSIYDIFSYQSTGSSAGIRDVLAGKYDLAFSSRELTNTEKEKLDALILAEDIILIIANQSIPQTSLTLSEVQNIFEGKIKNWDTIFPGLSQPIITISREDNSGTFTTFKELLNIDTVSRDSFFTNSNGSMFNLVKNTPYSIGYISYKFFDEIQKTSEVSLITLTDHPGPLKRNLYLVLPQDAPENPLRDQFIAFLFSRDGKILMEKSGFLPISSLP